MSYLTRCEIIFLIVSHITSYAHMTYVESIAKSKMGKGFQISVTNQRRCSLILQAEAHKVLEKVISQLNSESKLKIKEGFAVSSKSGSGIDALKTALKEMVPTRVVPSSYEKLLVKLRSHSTEIESPFLMAEDVQLLARSKEVRSYANRSPQVYICIHAGG